MVVDATWGTIAPISLAPGVSTIGELELIRHIQSGGTLIDTRSPDAYAEGTIPTARNIPHGEAGDAIATLDANAKTAFFCNGPQCAATPDAVSTLLGAGFPAPAILYYRGGLHDWVTLGLPIARPEPPAR